MKNEQMTDEIDAKLRETALIYPSELVASQLADIRRIGFHLGLVRENAPQRDPALIEMCDLGGGVGLFSTGGKALGFKRVVLVDDFGDGVNDLFGERALDPHRRLGVEVFSRDVVAEGVLDIEGQFDAVTTFDSMEHWHHSPKRLFAQVREKLKPGGVFVLGVPNCVNLRKRITVPLGYGKWSAMGDWYEHEAFRGHVREPDIDDLRYIGRDMGLEKISILGRNWLGFASPRKAVQAAARVFDPILKPFPQLCSDIYLIGRKP